MKLKITILLFSVFLFSVFGKTTINQTQNGVKFTAFPEKTTEIKSNYTIALPSKSVKVTDGFVTFEKTDRDGKIEIEKVPAQECVKVKNSFIMRELYGHEIDIDLQASKTGSNYSIKDINFNLEEVEPITTPLKVSEAFLPIYRSIVDNFDNSYLNNIEWTHPTMLVITKESLVGALEMFFTWKRQTGIEIQVATLESIGSTNTDIKNYIQNIYNTSDNPPSYVLFVGDVDDTYAVPAFYYGSENNVNDHTYTLLEGDDYFPEMIAGRISIDSETELYTVISKVLKYEKTPYTANSEWFKKALMVAGNYSSQPPTPTTPVKVSMWLKDKMLDYGYNQVDELYYWPPQHNTYPGTDEIISAINSGVGFVSYRGWGNAYGWNYPYFHTENIDNLNNGLFLPIVSSVVCNTGDFANVNVDPVFCEKLIRAGTVTQPKGAVATFGPSDLHTSTKFNNAIFSGFYYGILDENIHSLGTAVLRGKVELYDNYPLNRDPGDQVEFYYMVYNIIGDPSINMWTDVPQEFTMNAPTSIPVGMPSIDITVPGLTYGKVTAVMNGDLYSVSRIENGMATVYSAPTANSFPEGTLTITVTGANVKPIIQDIEVSASANLNVGLLNVVANGQAIPGRSFEASLTLKNFTSSTVSGLQATLSGDANQVNVTTGTQNIGDLSAGAEANVNFNVQVLGNSPSNQPLEFVLSLTNGQELKFVIGMEDYNVMVNDIAVDGNGVLEAGETANITVTFEKHGNITPNSINVTLHPLNNAVTVPSANATISSFNSGIATAQFTLSADANCTPGKNVGLQFIMTEENGKEFSAVSTIVVGPVSSTAPTGPDNYGYYAYDSFDAGYSETPTYNWIEIDPNAGGAGTVIEMGDDASDVVSLPFTFKYYGQDFNTITICSNGWIAFDDTWMKNFRNWRIPAALGPNGMVAPYWDDLIGAPNGSGNDPMRICHYYDSSLDAFIIEWNDTYNNFDDVSLEKFQVILYNQATTTTVDGNGKILVNYHTVNNPDANNNYATVGIESPDQSDGVLYTFANINAPTATPLQNNMSILYTTNAPDNFVGISDEPEVGFELLGNYPNPFNPETTIKFRLSEAGFTGIKIYNVSGALVRNLISTQMNSGVHSVKWDGKDNMGKSLTSGVYFYKLESGKYQSATKKCFLLK